MFFKSKKANICSDCKNIKVTKKFSSSKRYLSAIEQLKKLLSSGNYELVFSSCPLDKVIDENGYWFDDLIAHEIKCKKCGTTFRCSCDTYHGRASLEKCK